MAVLTFQQIQNTQEVTQIMIQAQITTYSGAVGGAALEARQ